LAKNIGGVVGWVGIWGNQPLMLGIVIYEGVKSERAGSLV